MGDRGSDDDGEGDGIRAEGVFPLAFVAPVLEEPLDCMASHSFEGAQADRGELWFSKGVALCVTAMVDADADHGGVHSEADTSSAPAEWGWAEIAEPGERHGESGLVPLTHLTHA